MTRLISIATRPLIWIAVLILIASALAIAALRSAPGDHGTPASPGSTTLVADRAIVESLTVLEDDLARIRRVTDLRREAALDWAAGRPRPADQPMDPSVEALELGLPGLVALLQEAGPFEGLSGQEIFASIAEVIQERAKKRHEGALSSAELDDPPPASRLYQRHVAGRPRVEQSIARLPFGVNGVRQDVLHEPLRRTLAEGFIASLEEEAELSRARAFLKLPDRAVEWLRVERPWRTLREEVAALDGDRRRKAIDESAMRHTSQADEEDRPRRFEHRPLAPLDLLDALERFELAFDRSRPTTFLGGSRDELFDAARAARIVFAATDSDTAVVRAPGNDLHDHGHHYVGVGRSDWNAQALSVTFPDPPITYEWSGGVIVPVRSMLTRHVTIMEERSSVAGRASFQELDFGIRFSASRWSVDAGGDPELRSLGEAEVLVDVLASTLHDLGLPPFAIVATTTADSTPEGPVLRFALDVPGLDVDDWSPTEVELDAAILGTPAELARRLHEAALDALESKLATIPSRARLGDVLRAAPTSMSTAIVHGASIARGAAPVIEMRITTEQGWPLQLRATQGPSGLRVNEISGSGSVARAIAVRQLTRQLGLPSDDADEALMTSPVRHHESRLRVAEELVDEVVAFAVPHVAPRLEELGLPPIDPRDLTSAAMATSISVSDGLGHAAGSEGNGSTFEQELKKRIEQLVAGLVFDRWVEHESERIAEWIDRELGLLLERTVNDSWPANDDPVKKLVDRLELRAAQLLGAMRVKPDVPDDWSGTDMPPWSLAIQAITTAVQAEVMQQATGRVEADTSLQADDWGWQGAERDRGSDRNDQRPNRNMIQRLSQASVTTLLTLLTEETDDQQLDRALVTNFQDWLAARLERLATPDLDSSLLDAGATLVGPRQLAREALVTRFLDTVDSTDAGMEWIGDRKAVASIARETLASLLRSPGTMQALFIRTGVMDPVAGAALPIAAKERRSRTIELVRAALRKQAASDDVVMPFEHHAKLGRSLAAWVSTGSAGGVERWTRSRPVTVLSQPIAPTDRPPAPALVERVLETASPRLKLGDEGDPEIFLAVPGGADGSLDHIEIPLNELDADLLDEARNHRIGLANGRLARELLDLATQAADAPPNVEQLTTIIGKLGKGALRGAATELQAAIEADDDATDAIEALTETCTRILGAANEPMVARQLLVAALDEQDRLVALDALWSNRALTQKLDERFKAMADRLEVQVLDDAMPRGAPTISQAATAWRVAHRLTSDTTAAASDRLATPVEGARATIESASVDLAEDLEAAKQLLAGTTSLAAIGRDAAHQLAHELRAIQRAWEALMNLDKQKAAADALRAAAQPQGAWLDPECQERASLVNAMTAFRTAVDDLGERVPAPLRTSLESLAPSLAPDIDLTQARATLERTLVQVDAMLVATKRVEQAFGSVLDASIRVRDVRSPEDATRTLKEIERTLDILERSISPLESTWPAQHGAVSGMLTDLRTFLTDVTNSVEAVHAFADAVQQEAAELHEGTKQVVEQARNARERLSGATKCAIKRLKDLEEALRNPSRWTEFQVIDETSGRTAKLFAIETCLEELADTIGSAKEILAPLATIVGTDRWSALDARLGRLGESASGGTIDREDLDLARQTVDDLLGGLGTGAAMVARAEDLINRMASDVEGLLDTDPRTAPAQLNRIANDLDEIGTTLGLGDGTGDFARELSTAIADGQALREDVEGLADAIAGLPEALAADLAATTFEPTFDLRWNEETGDLDLHASFGSLGTSAVAGVLGDPRLADSAIVDWLDDRLAETGLPDEMERTLKELERETLQTGRLVVESLREKGEKTLEEMKANLPSEIDFLGIRLRVEYGTPPGSLVTLVHEPEAGSPVPAFSVTGLVDLQFSAELEGDLDFSLRLRPNARLRFGSLRPALQVLLGDLLPPGLSFDDDPMLEDGVLTVPFRYRPSALPITLEGALRIEDFQKVSVAIGDPTEQVRTFLVDALYTTLEEATLDLVADGDVPGIGPLELRVEDGKVCHSMQDRGEPGMQDRGEPGLIVHGRLAVNSDIGINLDVHLGFESGLSVKVKPSAIGGMLAPVFDELFGDDALFRVRPASPFISTDDVLRVHLDYDMQVPVLGGGLGGKLELSTKGVDLGPGLTLRIPGWLEAPPIAMGNVTATLDPKDREIALSASVTLSPGPASVNLIDCRLTGSLTFREPIAIAANGRVNLFRVVNLGHSTVQLVPQQGSFEATVATSPLLGELFRLEGFLQIEANRENGRPVRGRSWNIAFQSETEVLGLARQTVEGGLNWNQEGLLGIEVGLPLADAGGSLTFGPGFDDPTLRFEGRVAKQGDLANIAIFVIAKEQAVQVHARATMLGLPLGVDFILTDLSNLTAERVISELLAMFELSLEFDPRLGWSNASGEGPEPGSREIGEIVTPDTDAAPAPSQPPTEEPPAGKLGWVRMATMREVIVGYRKSGGVIGTSFLSESNAIKEWHPFAVNGSEPYAEEGTQEQVDGRYQMARSEDGRFVLVTNARGMLRCHDTLKGNAVVWRGRTSPGGMTDARNLVLRPILVTSGGIGLFTDYGGEDTVAARPGARLPVTVPSRFTDDRLVSLTGDTVQGEDVRTVLKERDKVEANRQLIEFVVELALARTEFDGYETLSSSDEELVALLERRSGNSTERWIYASLKSRGVAARVDTDDASPAELSTLSRGLRIALRELRSAGTAVALGQNGSMPVVARLVRVLDAGRSGPSLGLVARGDQPRTYRLHFIGTAAESRTGHQLEILPELGSGGAKAADEPTLDHASRLLTSTQVDPCLVALRNLLSAKVIELKEPVHAIVRLTAGTAQPVRRVVASWSHSNDGVTTSLIDRGLARAQGDMVSTWSVTLHDLTRYWELRSSAVPPGFTDELASRLPNFLRLVALDDWESRTSSDERWRADPSGAFKP